MVVLPTLPISLSYDFIAKSFTIQGVTFGKVCSILGLSINPIVASIICGALIIGTILTWIYRKEIITFLKKALYWITGKKFDIK